MSRALGKQSSIDPRFINVDIELDTAELTLLITGDYHLGVRGVNPDHIKQSLIKEIDEAKGDVVVIYTGDIIENALKNSIGHNYDILYPDVNDQIEMAESLLTDVNKHIYGKKFDDVNLKTKRLKNVKTFGLIGNHEYRSRKTAGLYPDERFYGPSNTVRCWHNAIITLNIWNKRYKKQRKTYKVFCSHAPTARTTAVGFVKACDAKRKEFPNIDVYAFGHIHKEIVHKETYTDTTSGRKNKAFYVSNPSPMSNVEYADFAGFNPLELGVTSKIMLPVGKFEEPYAII